MKKGKEISSKAEIVNKFKQVKFRKRAIIQPSVNS